MDKAVVTLAFAENCPVLTSVKFRASGPDLMGTAVSGAQGHLGDPELRRCCSNLMDAALGRALIELLGLNFFRCIEGIVDAASCQDTAEEKFQKAKHQRKFGRP